jgi:hypothetical protein
MTIRELIDRLEKIDKESNKGAHGEPTIYVNLELDDEDLDAMYFTAKLTSVEESVRFGCYCTDGADLNIKVIGHK